jgi:hypothetical protein
MGMLHGAQKGLFDLLFRVPAMCADMVNGAVADIGIIPSFELIGRDLGIVPRLGICCQGERAQHPAHLQSAGPPKFAASPQIPAVTLLRQAGSIGCARAELQSRGRITRETR